VKRALGPAVTALVAAAVVGLLIYGLTRQGTSRALDQALAAGRLPAAPNASRELPVLNGVDAEQVALARWRGSVLVVNFWASWCPPCTAEAPLLEHAQRLLASRHEGTLVGITYKDTTTASLAAVKTLGLTYPNLRDIDGSYAEAYGTDQIPETFVLNRQLHVVWISRGEVTSAPALAAAIAKAART
jgi:cytochrome c biogenesis protein CcmG/thiol:disulfide interchange protein DsbE